MLGQVRSPQGIYSQSVSKQAEVGFKMPFNDGRVFVYCKDGGAGLTMGQLVQAPEVDTTNDVGIAVIAAAKATDKQLSVTILSAHGNFVANAYAGGWLLIDYHTEQGLARKIKSHGAFTTGADATVVFKFRDELGVAVATATHTVKILANPYSLVVVNATVTGLGSTTGRTLGVNLIDITASYYFWLLTRGIGPGKNDDGAVIKPGTDLTAAGTCVEIMTAYGDPLIGTAASYCADNSKSLLVDYKL